MKTKNLWKCPKCEKIVDYGGMEPSKGRTQCDKTGEEVQMKKVESPMQKLQTYNDAQNFLVNCVGELLAGYEFKLTDIIDANRRCIPQPNSVAMRQLNSAFQRFKEVEQWHNEHDQSQKCLTCSGKGFIIARDYQDCEIELPCPECHET